MRSSSLLSIDAAINLVLGVLLILFPARLVTLLGVPKPETPFYAAILGAVLFGIGLALLIERSRGSGGLGLLGAVSINMSGGFVLVGWLLFGGLDLPLRGLVFLWGLAFILVAIGAFELWAHASSRQKNSNPASTNKSQ